MVSLTRRVSFLYLFIFTLSFLSSCHVSRYFYWNFADVNDYRKFGADTIDNELTTFHFESAHENLRFDLPEKYSTYDNFTGFDDFLKATKTLSFLVIRHDTVIYSNYFKGYDSSSVFSSFSISKSFISALIGIALEEGVIKSLDQSVTEFIPEMKDPGFSKVTIKDLLEMRSGIKFKEGYADPFSGMAKFYYGRNLRKYTLNLKVVSEPGQSYNYQSANSQILAMILERATGMKISDYLEEKIWKPLGMENRATWNVDSKKFNEVKAFCCINATSIDFAKFGRLYLDSGKWDDHQIIPEEWITESLQIKNDSRDSQGFPYTYLWRSLENGDFFAKGILGQYIYICPQKEIIIVRTGANGKDVIWPHFFREIISQL